MREYVLEKLPNEKFTLHDASVGRIYVKNGDLILETDYGFVDLAADRMVNGRVVLKGVSLEDSYLHLMKYDTVLCGNLRKFSGEKLDLTSFLERYRENQVKLEIMYEYRGYRTYFITGFLFIDGEIFEVHFEIYYTGEFVYQVVE